MSRGPGILVFLVAAVGALVGHGCGGGKDSKAMTEEHIDRAWFRRSLVEDNLAHWLAAAPAPNGFFRTTLDRQWRPAATQTATLVSQSRMLYVLSVGYEVTGRDEYLQAVRKGAEFLLAHFSDRGHGGFFWSVAPEGRVLEKHKSSYGHAFAIFGLAHAYRVTGERRFAEAALRCWDDVKAHLRYPSGGIKPQTTRDFSQVRGTNTQNPMMHLFEALLALHDATGSRQVFDDAGELAGFIYERLYDREGGFLPERYTEQWERLPIERGGFVDLGHQFEWAYLLSRAVEKGFPRRYLDIGRRLLDFGMRVAYDRSEGGIFSRGDYAGRRLGGAGKGWWQQCELLRALMHYAALRGREDLWEPFAQSLAFVKEHFLDAEYGGWYGSYEPGRGPVRRDKGSTWKVGYHAAGMHAEALRLTGGMR